MIAAQCGVCGGGVCVEREALQTSVGGVQTSARARAAEDAQRRSHAAGARTHAHAPVCCAYETLSGGRCRSAMLANVMPHLNVGAQKWTAKKGRGVRARRRRERERGGGVTMHTPGANAHQAQTTHSSWGPRGCSRRPAAWSRGARPAPSLLALCFEEEPVCVRRRRRSRVSSAVVNALIRLDLARTSGQARARERGPTTERFWRRAPKSTHTLRCCSSRRAR